MHGDTDFRKEVPDLHVHKSSYSSALARVLCERSIHGDPTLLRTSLPDAKEAALSSPLPPDHSSTGPGTCISAEEALIGPKTRKPHILQIEFAVAIATEPDRRLIAACIGSHATRSCAAS